MSTGTHRSCASTRDLTAARQVQREISRDGLIPQQFPRPGIVDCHATRLDLAKQPQHLVGIGTEYDHPGEDISAVDAIETLPDIADATAFASMYGKCVWHQTHTFLLPPFPYMLTSALANAMLDPNPLSTTSRYHLRPIKNADKGAPDEDSEGDEASTSGQGKTGCDKPYNSYGFNHTERAARSYCGGSGGGVSSAKPAFTNGCTKQFIAPATTATATIRSFSRIIPAGSGSSLAPAPAPPVSSSSAPAWVSPFQAQQASVSTSDEISRGFSDAMAQDQSALSSSLPLPLTCTNLPNVVHNSVSQGLLHSKWTFCKPYSQISSKDFYSSDGPKSFALSQAIISSLSQFGPKLPIWKSQPHIDGLHENFKDNAVIQSLA
ncbi:hypothetical protein SELMODRAFT_411974 [Selaginella moellendorffii]|uniref:Uncharacterized protein n=1 Tax=Selaginella moellendorffii TaxID=88036 RepID=D8RJM5_SELML|nr:hypothetical protein SELMODRAFT_411974 [Selaginella moellendorffii]